MRHARTLSVASLLILLPACVSAEAYRQTAGENEALRRQRDDLARRHQELEGKFSQLQGEAQRLSKSAADAKWIEEQKQKLNRLIAEFEQGGAKNLPGVTVLRTPEGIAFKVQGEVLFDSGKAELRENGQRTLKTLVPELLTQGKRVRVDGHTDSDPIVNSPWRTNLRLSVERALAVSQFLIENGFPADRITVAGYGEHQPTAAGTSEEAKRANRRVEILMLDERK